jgi:GNAT superfamily N-acetyltransferase
MNASPLGYRLATRDDLSLLVGHIRDFYLEDEIVFHPQRVEQGMAQLLADPANGAILILTTPALAFAGYITLGWCFSVEQGGRFVLLDELYLLPATRGGGLGRKALNLAADWAREAGAQVVRLEVNHHNARAKALYLGCGYVDDRRDLLTLDLGGA